QLAAGTCEIVTLDRDSSQPRRTIARQTARCACKKGQIAGTTRARPACVD
ncbi:PREDICTED: protein FAM19A5, partial [Merops nubicus]